MVLSMLRESLAIWSRLLVLPFMAFSLLWRMIPVYLNGFLASVYFPPSSPAAVFGVSRGGVSVLVTAGPAEKATTTNAKKPRILFLIIVFSFLLNRGIGADPQTPIPLVCRPAALPSVSPSASPCCRASE